MVQAGISMKSNSVNHILILTPGFPEHEEDSTCIPALQVYVKALQERISAENISIITFHYPFKNCPYHWHGVNVYPMNDGNRKWIYKPILWLKVLRRVFKINRLKRISLIHSFWYSECAFIGGVLSLLLKRPHVCTFMGQEALSKHRYGKLILNKPYLVALSDFHAISISDSLGIQPDKIIPWGIEKNDLKSNPSKRLIDVIGVGSLIPLKNYSLFIDVIGELVKQKKELICVLIGEGNERKLLEDKIVEMNLSDHIELRGATDRSEVLNYMNQSKVLLHTSNYESFGMVFIEALQAGASIVSKPVGCFQESDSWKIGGDKIQLQKAVLELLQNKPLSKPPSFNIHDTVRSYLDIYELKMSEKNNFI